MGKLVRLDDETLGFTEIDKIKLKRVAAAFRDWLLGTDLNKDPFNYLKCDLPLVDVALNGNMKFPYKGPLPHVWEIGEGSIPREYISMAAPFYNTIHGEHCVHSEIVERDGKRCAWMYFEESVDNI